MAVNCTLFQKKHNFTFSNKLIFTSEQEKSFIKKKILELPKIKNSIKFGIKYSRYINSDYIPFVDVRYIPQIQSFGLFTNKQFKKGDYIGEYTGLITSETSYLKMYDYLLEYPVHTLEERPYSIDAEPIGNHTRFINHSFRPNLAKHYAFYQNFYHMIFLCDRDIEKDQQLTFDYGKNYWYLRGAPLDF